MGAVESYVGFAGTAVTYAYDVVDGRILAGKWTLQAARRFLDDLAKQDTEWPYTFEPRKVEKVCRFVETLPHIKGRWKSATLKLEPWQVFICANVFGWLHKEADLRRFRTVYVEMARKQGKSFLLSALMLYALTLDGEQGPEVYSVATTRQQARILFDTAREMARRSTFLQREGVKVGTHNIHVPATVGKCEPLSSDSKTLDGLSVSFGAIDELHAHKTRDVWDVIETATSARSQSLVWAITTAGSNRAGICYEMRTYLTKLLDGVAADDTVYGVIYSIDDDDDPWDSRNWVKSNPNLGVSVFQDDLERKAVKAREMPSAINNFLTKHLNVWVSSSNAWMDMRKWDACRDTTLTLEQFHGCPVWLGLDLATEIDIATICLLFYRDGNYYPFLRNYLPEDAVTDSRNSQYSGWVRQGKIITTPGASTDFAYIENDIIDITNKFDVRDIGLDPHQAHYLATRLQEQGIEAVKIPPNVLQFSEPMKRIDALVRTGPTKLKHDGCPVLAWMLSNVVCYVDAKENIYPRKERPENKIDGVVAMIMAMRLAMNVEHIAPSVYESRGILFL